MAWHRRALTSKVEAEAHMVQEEDRNEQNS